MNRIKIYITVFAVFYVLSAMFGLSESYARTVNSVPELTKQNVLAYMIEIGIREPLVAFQLSMLETGHLRSHLAKKHYNLFGMKKPGRWETRANRVLKGRNLSYSDWRLSVDDFKEYQDRFIKVSFKEHFENSNYSAKRNHYKSICRIRITPEILEFAINKVNEYDYTKNILNHCGSVPYSWAYLRLVS